MIHVSITTEFEEDYLGPHEIGTDRFVLPEWFADDASEAHAKLLKLIAEHDYLELPQTGNSPIPLNTFTVRMVAVWEA